MPVQIDRESLAEISDKVVFYSLVLLVFLAPLIFLPFLYDSYDLAKVSLLRLLILIMLVAWAVKVLASEHFHWVKNPLNLPAFAFLGAAALATIFSVNPTASWFGEYGRYESLPTLISYVLLFVAAANFVSSRERIRMILDWLLAASIIISLYGIAQHFGFQPVPPPFSQEKFLRGFSTFGNPVFLAGFLTMVLPLALVSFLYIEDKQKRLFYGASLVTAATALLFTYTRGGWLGGIVGLFCLVLLERKFLWQKRLVLAKVLLVALSLVVLATVLSSLVIREQSQLGAKLIETVSFKGGGAGRMVIWQTAATMFANRSLTGWGPENFKQAFTRYRPLEYIRIEGPRVLADRAHNDIMHISATMGVLGLICYFWILVVLYQVASRLLRLGERRRGRLILSGLLASVAGYLAQEMFAPSVVGVTSLFWVLLGLIIAEGQTNLGRPVFPVLEVSWVGRVLKKVPVFVAGLVLFLVLAWGGIFTLRPVLADAYFNKASKILRESFHPVPGELSLTSAVERRPTRTRAIFYLEKAVATNPWQKFYHVVLAQNYQMIAEDGNEPEMMSKAIDEYQRAIELDPMDPFTYQNLGSAFLFQASVWENLSLRPAEEAFSKAIEIDKYFADARAGLGALYLEKRDYAKAIWEEKEAIRIDPRNINGYFLLGAVYEKLGRKKESIYMYQKVVELSPTNLEARQALERLQKD